jgi:uncharacterized protein
VVFPFDPREWICPLLAVEADAFNHGGTPEFAAISAVAVRHNDISNGLNIAAMAHSRSRNTRCGAHKFDLL